MKQLFLILLGFSLSSCVMQPPELPRQQLPQSEIQTRASNLTPGMIKKHIEIRKTTQAEVMEIFGPPDMVTRSGNGEMWGYDKVSREVAEAAMGANVGAGSRIGGGGAGLVGGGAPGIVGGILGTLGGSYGQSTSQSQTQSRRTETTTTVFMLIYFDEKSVVTDYKLSATKF